jgi:hypothetical protein
VLPCRVLSVAQAVLLPQMLGGMQPLATNHTAAPLLGCTSSWDSQQHQ